MEALVFDSTTSGVKLADKPIPNLGKNELLVAVHAAGVTRAELNWYPTSHTKNGQPRKNAIVGHEFSGIVYAVGAAVEDFHVNDAIYGMNDWFDEGATAEYCVTVPEAIAPKPESLLHQEAATVPISALTAWQGLYDRARLRPGDRVLIHGGAGSVGGYAVQLASLRGARTTATASAENATYVRGLGAEVVVDYHSDLFATLTHKFDVVFDTVGGATLQRSWSLLQSGGRLVTIASGEEAYLDERTKEAFFIVKPDQSQLLEVSALLDRGAMKVKVSANLPLRDAATAYDSARHFGVGKVVISIKQRIDEIAKVDEKRIGNER